MNWIAESKQRQRKKQAVQAIDVLLADKPDAFRATVYELSRQLGWADDEPSFLLAIATNQLEALVKQYPERISKVMKQAAGELKTDWHQMQTKLSIAAIERANAENRIAQKLIETQLMVDGELSRLQQVMADARKAAQQTMAAERAAVQQLLADERTAMLAALSQERAAMLAAMAEERAAVQQLLAGEQTALEQRALALTEQQKEVLEKQTKSLIVEGLDSWAKRSTQMVQQVIKDVRGVHYWQACAWACGSALGVICLTLLGQGMAQRYSEWGRFEQWNQSHLKDCRYVDSATCNFHIKPPQ